MRGLLPWVTGLFSGGWKLGLFPLIRQPRVEVVDRGVGEIGQQLGEVSLRVDLVSSAGAGQAAEDGRGLSAVGGGDEEKCLQNLAKFAMIFSR